jgi:sigma-B regulation protein RsbU (phosphoserine phosphatase)
MRDTTWATNTVILEPGDVLALYTDGVTEAQNVNGELFEVARLLDAVQNCRERTARAAQDAVLAAVDRFVGAAPQSDDLTMLVVVRDSHKMTNGE